MEEIKCDHCGEVIKGYYPDTEMKGINLYKCDVIVPGTKKEKANCNLTIDFRHGSQPVEYRFCSISCLKEHLEHIKSVMDE